MLLVKKIIDQAEFLFGLIDSLSFNEKVEVINKIRVRLSEHSPFANEPVDCVQWMPAEQIESNDYNPNTVAPPEMKLLQVSIDADGFTQPVVTCPIESKRYLIVDGFHRYRIGAQSNVIKERLFGHIPVVFIRRGREGVSDRMAATIRHNRARGVHGVLPMTDVVVTLMREGWTEQDIARRLGMDNDEVLRFKQVSGLPELFRNHHYSLSWD